MDVGQPKDYLAGTFIYLNYLKSKEPQMLAKGENIVGNVLIVFYFFWKIDFYHNSSFFKKDPSAQISKTALIGPDVIIGPGCIIEDGVFLDIL